MFSHRTGIRTGMCPLQGCSQNTVHARARHGHTMFVRSSVQNAKAFGGAGGMLSQKNFGSVELPRSILRLLLSHKVALNQEYSNQAVAMNLYAA